jgi:hypothetical protein
MALQRVTLRLTQLRCITESDGSGSSEPYMWTTFFAFGAQPLPGQTGPMTVITPAYDAFRTEFENNVQDGDLLSIPPFIASASFDMDLDGQNENKLVGCIAVVMEEDETPGSSIVLGRIAYSKEIEKQLNHLVIARVQAGDFGPVTDEEIRVIREAVQSKVESAIGSNQGIFDIFKNQDDNVGFTHRGFIEGEIQAAFFDFPEIVSEDSTNRYVLSGNLSIGAIPTEPIDLCKTPRAALQAKKDEIKGLQTRKSLLQVQLQNAPPQAKAAIVDAIEETNALITQAEAELPALQEALDACMERFDIHEDIVVVDEPIVVGPG